MAPQRGLSDATIRRNQCNLPRWNPSGDQPLCFFLLKFIQALEAGQQRILFRRCRCPFCGFPFQINQHTGGLVLTDGSYHVRYVTMLRDICPCFGEVQNLNGLGDSVQLPSHTLSELFPGCVVVLDNDNPAALQIFAVLWTPLAFCTIWKGRSGGAQGFHCVHVLLPLHDVYII